MYWITLFSALICCCVWLTATMLMNENEYSSIRWYHFAILAYHGVCVADKRNDC